MAAEEGQASQVAEGDKTAPRLLHAGCRGGLVAGPSLQLGQGEQGPGPRSEAPGNERQLTPLPQHPPGPLVLAGDLPEAGELLGRSLEIRRRVGDRRGVGLTVANQGLVAAATGDLERADRLLREAYLLFEEMGDGPGRWGALLDLGLVLLDAGQHDRARRVLRQWSELPLIPWSFRPRAWTLLALAELERRSGDQTAAAACAEEARRRFVALGDLTGLSFLGGPAKSLLSGR